MANNRMYLRCKGCGATFFLGKRFGNGYYISQYAQYNGVPLLKRLNQFYEEHEWCGDAGLDCFELIYEEPPKPLTNADRIRAMTDEELAESFAKQCAGRICNVETKDCKECWLDWLKQEADNG